MHDDIRVWNRRRLLGGRLLLSCVVGLLALAPALGGRVLADATPVPDESLDASISFWVGVCPPDMTAFGNPVQVDGAPNCDGTGLAGSEPPLAGGVVTLTAAETGDVTTIALDGSGQGSAAIAGGLTYVAQYGLGSALLESRSGCGSAMSGLAGASESGVHVSPGEAMSCKAVTLVATPTPVSNAIALSIRGCPGVTDASSLLIGDGVLDCNGDPSSDESVAIGSGTATFQNLTMGTSVDVSISSEGTAVLDPAADGGYVVSLVQGGVGLAFASVCGGRTADAVPLGLLGGIGDPDAPLQASGGERLQCSILVALGDTGVSVMLLAMTMEFRACPAGFSVATPVASGQIADLNGVDSAFANACTTPITVQGLGGPVTPDQAGYQLEGMPGTLSSVTVPAESTVLWASCRTPSTNLYPMSVIPGQHDTLILVALPATMADATMACTVYVVAPA